MNVDGSRSFQVFEEIKAPQNGGTAAADKFSADAMARVGAGFPNADGNAALPQTDP